METITCVCALTFVSLFMLSPLSGMCFSPCPLRRYLQCSHEVSPPPAPCGTSEVTYITSNHSCPYFLVTSLARYLLFCFLLLYCIGPFVGYASFLWLCPEPLQGLVGEQTVEPDRRGLNASSLID